MDISENQKKELIKKLLFSRTRLLCSHPFFGLLLMNMRFSLDPELSTAATDGEFIYFGAKFLSELSDGELDFILMHEILHVALGHCFRGEEKDDAAFNIACDIVVNSNILLESGDVQTITVRKYGESMHVAPDGKEGYNYTAEEVYAMLPHSAKKSGSQNISSCGRPCGKKNQKGFDDHSKWGGGEGKVWIDRVKNAAAAVSIREKSLCRGLIPLAAQRLIKEFGKPQLNWRSILNNFVQEEVCDYSFAPPDRRYDGDFFLPDLNEKDEKIKGVLFMIDTSGSMSDDMIKGAYSEIKGAIDQFGGKLNGLLGFFDAVVVPPTPFSDEESLRIIRPYGGGGMVPDFHRDGFVFDEELFVRYCQVAAMFPMMQFSRAPWKVLSENNQKICLDAVGLHGDLAEYIIQTAKRCAASGEPMIRNLEYAYPHSGYATVNDEFLLGEDILVAPQLKKSMSTRQVVIPDGIWEDAAGKKYRKGNYTVDTPITVIPVFKRIGK